MYSEVYIFFDFRKGLDTKLRLNVGFEDVSFALMSRPEVWLVSLGGDKVELSPVFEIALAVGRKNNNYAWCLYKSPFENRYTQSATQWSF